MDCKIIQKRKRPLDRVTILVCSRDRQNELLRIHNVLPRVSEKSNVLVNFDVVIMRSTSRTELRCGRNYPSTSSKIKDKVDESPVCFL